jgi:hypothetical protein
VCPNQRRPICAALLLIHLSAEDSTGLVPWSKDAPLEDERWVRIAIEANNDTEPHAVIAKRANLRLDPGLHGQVLRTLTQGEILDVLNCTPVSKDGHLWLRVLVRDMVVPGWVAQDLVVDI